MTPEDITIQSLRRENSRLRRDLDAAIKEIPHICNTCRYEDSCSVECEQSPSVSLRYWGCTSGSQWSWKGIS